MDKPHPLTVAAFAGIVAAGFIGLVFIAPSFVMYGGRWSWTDLRIPVVTLTVIFVTVFLVVAASKVQWRD
jgi:hypothetical protein